MKTNEIYLGDANELIKQIPDKSVDLIVTDPPPFLNGHYLKDKEYCLYFWENGVKPKIAYERGKTVYVTSTNTYDKDRFLHPTIKPIEIIESLIRNSTGGCGPRPVRGKRDHLPRVQAPRHRVHRLRDKREVPQNSQRQVRGMER